MAATLSHSEYEAKFYNLYPEKNIKLLTQYESWNTKITHECLVCGYIWDQPPRTVMKGTLRCKKCKAEDQKLTNEEFVKRYYEKFPSSNLIFLSEYKSMHETILVRCNVCKKEYEKTPAKLYHRGVGCVGCYNKDKVTNHEEFIQKLTETFPEKKFNKIGQYLGMHEYIEIECDKGHTWSAPVGRLLHSPSWCPNCNAQQSKAEQEIFYKFKDVFIERDVSFGKEIDLLSHSHKFGIEFNGNTWHSFGLTFPNNMNKFDKNKHLKKTELLESNGYQLFHILEDHWLDPKKKDIWLSMISNKLGKSTKIFARKLKIIDLTEYKDFVKQFLTESHIQGYIHYKYAYGLQDSISGIVYTIMTFSESRYDKNIQWELLRFSTYKWYNIIGGASKLLKHFERTHQPESLISYADRDWSKGNVYQKLGFEFIENTQPNYWYYDSAYIRHSRQSCQKHKLKDKLPFFDENLTELENMLANEYRIYYNTGNIKFVKKYEKRKK